MSEFIKIPVSLAAKLVKEDAESLLTDLKGDADEMPDDAAEKLASKIANRYKAEKEDQRKRGIAEKGKAIERKVADLLKDNDIELSDRIEDDILSLVEKLKEQKAEPPTGGDSKELTKEEILNSPIYKELTDGLRSKLESKYNELEQTYTSFKNQTESEKKRSKVLSLARKILPEIKANNVDDDSIEFYINGMGGFDRFELTEDGKDVRFKQGDEYLDDGYGTPLGAKDIFQKTWKFGFNDVDPGKDGGKRRQGERGSEGGVSYTFKSADDYKQRLSAAKDHKTIAAMQKAYAEQLAKE
jgi:hypothetical protein